MFGELTSNRNGIAFLSFFFYLLCCADGERKIRKELLLVILFALLNQTNSIFLLLTVHFLHYLSSKTILRFKLVRIIYIKIIKVLLKMEEQTKNWLIVGISLFAIIGFFFLAQNIPTDTLEKLGGSLSLPVFTFIIALVDGFNPCTLFILTRTPWILTAK